MKLVDFFFALRPLVLVPAWSFFLLGHAAAGAGAFPTQRFVQLSLVLAGVHLVNQVADFETDRLNDKGFFLQRGVFSRQLYVAAGAAALIGGCAWAWVAADAPAYVAAAALLGLAYSLPPARLAGRPGLDAAANAAGYGGLAAVLGAGPEAAPGARWLAASMLAVGAVFVHTTLLDLEGDRRTGKRTSGVWLGPARSRVAAAVAAIAAALAAAGAGPALLAACATVALLAVLALRERVTSRSVCVLSTAAFVLAASAATPAFAAAVAALAAATRLYYRRRFARAYPAL